MQVQSDKSPQSHETYPDRLTYKLFFGGENHMIHLEKNRWVLLLGVLYFTWSFSLRCLYISFWCLIVWNTPLYLKVGLNKCLLWFRQLIGHNYTEIYYQDDGLIVSSNPNLKVTYCNWTIPWQNTLHTINAYTVVFSRSIL